MPATVMETSTASGAAVATGIRSTSSGTAMSSFAEAKCGANHRGEKQEREQGRRR